MELKEKLENILGSLTSIDGIVASALVRKDGLSLAFSSKDKNIKRDIAVSLASAFNTFEQTGDELKTGPLNYLLIKAKNRNIFFVEVSKDVLLISFLEHTVKITDIYNKSMKFTSEIMNILEEVEK